jgi:hypothetical protein
MKVVRKRDCKCKLCAKSGQADLITRWCCMVLGIISLLSGLVLITIGGLVPGIVLSSIGIVFMILTLKLRYFKINVARLFELEVQRD